MDAPKPLLFNQAFLRLAESLRRAHDDLNWRAPHMEVSSHASILKTIQSHAETADTSWVIDGLTLAVCVYAIGAKIEYLAARGWVDEASV